MASDEEEGAALVHDLSAFAAADNFGSLIRPKLSTDQIARFQEQTTNHSPLTTNHSLLQQHTHQKVLKALRQADYLSPKYHVVVANPPYMGNRHTQKQFKDFGKKFYPESKFDAFSMFIERNGELAIQRGLVSMITMQSWMFLSAFEGLRKQMLSDAQLVSFAHLGPNAFDTISGEIVSTTAFVFAHAPLQQKDTAFIRLVEGDCEAAKQSALLEAVKSSEDENRFDMLASKFSDIPGSPIAYWVSDKVRSLFVGLDALSTIAPAKKGMDTANNDRYLSSSLALFAGHPASVATHIPHPKIDVECGFGN